MCSPELMAGAGGAGGAAKAIEGYSNWRSQRDTRHFNMALATQSAKADLFSGWTELQIRRAQSLQQTSQEVQQLADRATLMSSTAIVGAAEAGVGGNTVQRMLNEYQRTSLIEQDRRLIQQDYYDRQIVEEGQHMRSQAQGRIYGAYQAPIAPFNWIGAVTGILGGAAKGFVAGGGSLFSSAVPGGSQGDLGGALGGGGGSLFGGTDLGSTQAGDFPASGDIFA